MCAATAMMRGIPSGAASSWQGAACPSIHEHPPARENDVILPNPGYRVDANIWHLDIREGALRPGPIASFLHHCNTMESPPNPSYIHGGPQPASDIQHLSREASTENLIDLQRYAERLQFETTCLRLWSNGIQDQIMDETQSSNLHSNQQLHRKLQPLHRHQLKQHLQVQLQAFQSEQPQCPRI